MGYSRFIHRGPRTSIPMRLNHTVLERKALCLIRKNMQGIEMKM